MSIMHNEMFEQPRVLRDAASNNAPTLEKIIAEIRSYAPHTVVFAARGSSDHACMYAKYLLEMYVGIPVSLSSPSVYTCYKRPSDLSGCVVIAVSQSGMAADVLEVVRSANASGAITIAMTNNADSPVAKEAKYHLHCSAGEEKALAATKTFTAQMYILLDLVTRWSEDPELKAVFDKVPDMVNEALSFEPKMIELAKRYRFMSDLFVLARGVASPIAFETALKMSETSYIRARGYAISDFYHGPFAMVDATTAVIMIACDKTVRADALAMLDKLATTDADVLVYTTDDEIAAKAKNVVRLPDGFEGPACVFPAVVLSQMLAHAVTLEKGIEPDVSRGLNKVTITK